MVQVKKPELREAILASAFKLFSRRGYVATTLPQIAKGAGVSPASVYIYFGSKLDVLYALYDPWLRQRITLLEQRLARIRSPRQRLRTLLGALWREIPRERNGFANNVMQAEETQQHSVTLVPSGSTRPERPKERMPCVDADVCHEPTIGESRNRVHYGRILNFPTIRRPT